VTDHPDDDIGAASADARLEESFDRDLTRLPPQIGEICTVEGAALRGVRGGDDDDDGNDGNRLERGRKRQRAIRIVATLMVLAVAYYAISVVQVIQAGARDEREPVDAIVVMGAAQFDGRPSPQLQARLDHVLVLWPENIAPSVVTTGGNLPGDRFTEAESSAKYLIAGGVPEDAILLEDEGSSTYESLEAVAALLSQRNLDSIVLVTDPYHAKRSQMIAESLGLSANVSSTTTSVVTGSDLTRRYLEEGAGVAIGRIIGMQRLDGWTN